MIKVDILDDGNIIAYDNTIADSVMFEKISFIFPESWNGYAKTAVFKNGGTTVSVVLDSDSTLCTGENECYVPYEVIKAPEFTVSVFGISGNSRATTPQALINVTESGYGEGDVPLAPTPSEYEQLLSLTTLTKQIAQSVRDDADNGAFKGEKGDTGDTGPQGPTGEKGDKGDKGDPAVTDQTYDPTSENAQSGKAVAEAVGEVNSNLSNLAECAKTEVKGNLHHYYFGAGTDKPIILANSMNTFVYPIKNGGTYIISIQGDRKIIGFANEEFETAGTLLSSFNLEDFTYTFTNEADYKYLYVYTGNNSSSCVVYMKSNLVLQDSIDELKINIDAIASNGPTPYKTYENYYIDSDGSLKGGESNTKVFIYPVVVGKTIELNDILTGGTRCVYAYDSDLKPIRDITTKHIWTECSMTYTVEEDVYYVGCETKNEWNHSAKYTDYKTHIRDNLINAMRYNDSVGNYCDNDFNLDVRDLTAGGYISYRDGKTITVRDSYYYSRYIKVKDNADILMQNCYAVEGTAFHCYDDEYNWIGRVEAGHDDVIDNEIFTTLINTKYIRFSLYVTKINTFKLSYANELPKHYWADRIVRDWMSESHYKIQKLFKNATSKPIITFCDDDTATVESVTRYHDACERNGIKGCYAMLDCQLSKFTELKDLLLSYERQGYHCVTHGYTQGSFYKNDSNRDLSLCEDDLIHSQQSFANYGFTDYKYWCTPYGVADDDIRNLAKKWGFKCAISSGNLDFNTSEEKWGRFALRRCTLNNNADELAEMKSRVDAAAACNGWLMITTHMAEEQWVSNQNVFDELVAYAKEKGMVPMTINQAWQLREPIYRLYEMF